MNRTLAAAAALAILAGPALAAEFEVSVSNFAFDPEELTVQVGDTVTWTNEQGLHNVNAPGFFRCADGCDGEGGNGDPALPPWSFSRTFTQEDVINYACEIHVAFGMTGRVTVVAGGGPTLTVTGTCPGSVTIAVSGGTPNGRVGLLFARNPGSDDLGFGPCADTMTGLDNPRFLAPMRLDGQGEGSLQATAPPAACGALLQGIDVATCDATNVAAVPNL